MNPWHDVTPGQQAPELVDCIIEVPRGSRNKYELDKKSGLLRLDRVLYSAVFYPANYGFIPQTYCDDRDPLDILVLGQEQVVPMCILTARPIGVMQMLDQNEEDDKIIAIHENDPAVSHLQDIHQLPEHTLNELQRFFEDYKILEHKKVRIERFLGLKEAQQIIVKSLELYTASFYADGSKRADAPVLHSELLEQRGGGRTVSPAARVAAHRRAAARLDNQAEVESNGETAHNIQMDVEIENQNENSDKSFQDGKPKDAEPLDEIFVERFPVKEWKPAARPPMERITFDQRTLEAHAPRHDDGKDDQA